MVFTRSQIDNHSREELIDELLKVSDISYQYKNLTDRFDTLEHLRTARNEEFLLSLPATCYTARAKCC